MSPIDIRIDQLPRHLFENEIAEARKRAIGMDSVWQLVWYPDTPVGHCCLCAPTLSELLEMAKEERR